MPRIVSQAFIAGIVSLFFVSNLLAQNITGTEAAPPATENAAEDSDPQIWVGISVADPSGEIEHYIGTISASNANDIEMDKYKRRFLKLSNLRVQGEAINEYNQRSLIHYNCADKNDWGVILINFKDIITIEYKKRDPIRTR